jgi:hypothetical protein
LESLPGETRGAFFYETKKRKRSENYDKDINEKAAGGNFWIQIIY